MRVTAWEAISCDAGWRNYHFLKLTTDEGIVGWSEFDESFGSQGLAHVVAQFAQALMGEEVGGHERLYAKLASAARPSFNGLAAAACGAIENALLDAKAKALGVPVYELLGGKIRATIPVYWSHCASWRIEHPSFYSPAIDSLDGVRAAGDEARLRGFTAIKTNMYLHDDAGVRRWMPGPGSSFGTDPNVDRKLIASIRAHLEALREGAGDGVGIMIDLNFNARPEGFLRLVEALADLNLRWIELDIDNPRALAEIRQRSSAPIASCEALFGVRQFLPFLTHRAVDVAVIDAVRNGVWQSMKIANVADGHDVNIAPHNFYGHLATMMSLHFAAAVSNLRILETDVDRIPWDAELFDTTPTIKDGTIVVPDRPGWGIEPIEAELRERPARPRGI